MNTIYKIIGGGQRVRQNLEKRLAIEVVVVQDSDYPEKSIADGQNSFTGEMWSKDLDDLQKWANEWAGRTVNLKLIYDSVGE